MIQRDSTILSFFRGSVSLISILFILLLSPVASFAVTAEPVAVEAAPVEDAAAVPQEVSPDEPAQKAGKGTIDAEAQSAAMTSLPTGVSEDVNSTYVAPSINTSAGSAGLSIPIAVLPGRLGVVPSISLAYSSLGANSWIGVGWGLDMGSIQCRVKDGLTYPCNDFIFSKGGSTSDLVLYSGSEYRAKVEDGSFIKFFKNGSGSNTSWTAYDKNGMVYTYGTEAATRLDDTTGAKIFKWALDKVTDSNSNYMTLSYYKDTANRELYLAQIDYTGNTNTNPDLLPTNQIVFNRDNGSRTDTATSYLSRFAVKTIYRLSSIEVKTIINGEYTTSYKYDLTYTVSPTTGRSMLSAVQLKEGEGTGSMPAQSFVWYDKTNDFLTDVSKGNRTANYNTDGAGGFQMADVNGDGFADFIYDTDTTTHDIRVLLGGQEGFSADTIWGNRLKTYNAISSVFRMADVNGDGLADLIYDTNTTNKEIRVLLSTGTGFAQDTLWGHRTANYNTDGAGGFQMVDLNGDGFADLLYDTDTSSHDIRVILSNSDGTGFQTDTKWGNRTKVYNPNSIGFRIADINGDGLPDLVYDTNTTAKEVRVLINSGAGFQTDTKWGNRTTAYNTSSGGFKMADVNGDGLPDFIYDTDTTDRQVHVLLNNGAGFQTDVKWGNRTTAYNTSSGGFRMADVNGDGLADFIYDTNTTGKELHVILSNGKGFVSDSKWGNRTKGYNTIAYGFRIADFNGDGLTDIIYDSDTTNKEIHVLENPGPFPDLLKTVDNGRGGSFEIVYEPSSSYENALLPFVLQTVSSITASTINADGELQTSTTNYTYDKGYYDLVEREFRGFGHATQINPDSSTYETWYHQRDTGPWYWNGTQWIDWPNCFETIADDMDYKGKVCHTELKEPNGTLLSETDMYWGRSVAQGTYPVFVRPTDKDITAYVGGTAIANHETYDYEDTDGTLKSVITSGPDAETITTENAYDSFGTYLIRNIRTTVTGSSSGKIRETTYGYQANTGNMLWKEFWLDGGTNPRITMEYYSDGNLWKEYDAAGYQPVVYEYDDATKTFPKTVTNALGHTRSNTYNYLYGKVDCATDENLNDTCAVYDSFGRPQEGISYSGNKLGGVIAAKTKTEYADFEFQSTGKPNFVKKRVLETKNGSAETYIDGYSFVDGFGRNIEAITFGEAGKSIVSKTFYDNMGRANYTEGPFFGTGNGFAQTTPSDAPWSETSFNFFGKPVSIQSPDGDYGSVISEIAYNGFSTTVYTPRAEADQNKIMAKTETKDYLGRIIQVVEYADAGQQTTNYTYNAAGDLRFVTDHYGNVTEMVYDTLGRKSEMFDPDMGHWVYHYDPNGNLSDQTDAKGQTISFEYDELNRVTSKTYSPTSSDNPPVAYSYDNPSIQNGKGRLYSVSNTKATTITNSYDTMGRAMSTTKTIEGNPVQYITATSYDYAGKPLTMTYPGGEGFSVTNTYHPGSGLLYQVTGSDGVVYATNTDYEPTGKIGQIDHENYTHTRYTYDPKSNRLTAIITTSPASDGNPRNDVINRGYTYTPAGDIAIITDYKKGNSLGLPGDVFNYAYTYDKLHRFTDESTTNNTYSPVAYTYNAIGNILTKNVGTTSFAYTYDPIKKHAVNSIQINGGSSYGFIYDDNGNMTDGYDLTDLQNISARTIGYNVDNMPVQVIHVRYGTTNISYDGTSNRVKKVSPSGTTYYVGEHYEVINNEPVKYVFAGNLRVAKISPVQGTKYFHKDHLGSSAAMTNELGSVQEESNYMPFGEMREHTGLDLSNYKYTDQEFDPETGLYYYGARYYDPTIGRFISADSVVQDPYDPQTLNRYTYCRNNPIIYTDPSGNIFGIDDAIIIIGAVIGAVSAGAQSDWNVGAMITGAFIGAISGAVGFGAGSWAYGAAGGEGLGALMAGGIIGGAAGGATGGGLSAAVYGGNIGEGILNGAAYGALAGGVTAGLIYAGVPNAIAAAGGGYASGYSQCGGNCARQGALYAFAGSVIRNAISLSGVAGNQVEIPEEGTPEWKALTEGKNDVYALTPAKDNFVGKLLGLIGDGNNHVWHTRDEALPPAAGRYATLIQSSVPWPGEGYWEPGKYNLFLNNCVTRFGLSGIFNPSQYNALHNYPGAGYYWSGGLK